jgi:hypothetical protein
MTRLSPQGLAVLHALSAVEAREYRRYDGRTMMTTAGQLTVAALVIRIGRRGASRTVTRASLSRTLRRLWRDGLVELSEHGRTLTEKRDHIRAMVGEQEADPEQAYAGYLAWRASIAAMLGQPVKPDPYGSVEYFMRARRRAMHQRPRIYVRDVQITEAGLARLTLNTTCELTDDNTTQRLTSPPAGELTT